LSKSNGSSGRAVAALSVSVAMESERRRFRVFDLTRFLDADRCHPRIKSEGMLRWKTL